MVKTSKFFITILLLCICGMTNAQTKPATKDSTLMYKNLERYSKKRGFTKFLHKLIFKPIAKNSQNTKSLRKEIPKNYNNLEGKIIRKIKIETLDPFGYSEIDSTLKPRGFNKNLGNKIHDKTSLWTIKNLLLFKKYEPLDSLLIIDSERLIRSQRYVRRVSITTKLPNQKSDSVDVYIRVLDSWSIIPNFSTSTSKSTFSLQERNFLGTGHEFKNTLQKSLNDNNNAYSAYYVVPNFKNTYINTTLNYTIDLDRNYTKSINVERPFFSSFTRWAGGINIAQNFRRELPRDTTITQIAQNFKNNSQDYYVARSFQLFKGQSEEKRTTNLISSARFFRANYTEKPTVEYDPENYFSSENFYLLGLGIASRKFKQEKYLYNYGIIEDVPIGIVYGITGGYQTKNDFHRYYFGARFSLGKFYKWGYLSSNLEYGSFFRNSSSEQNAVSLKLLYFTNLMQAGNWKFRQFVKPEIIIGNRRINSDFDRLTLNDNNGIQGFDSQSLRGTKKILITLQTQAYSPWNVWGFRLNPFLSATTGMLGNAQNGFKEGKLYTQFGVGLIISNDYLVFSSFQLSLSFYPNIPGNGDNIFKTNSFKTEDLGFQNFDFSKPQTIIYQ